MNKAKYRKISPGDTFHFWEVLKQIIRSKALAKISKLVSSKLNEDIVETPKGMTEYEHAKLDGLRKIYDCGKIRFKYLYKENS